MIIEQKNNNPVINTVEEEKSQLIGEICGKYQLYIEYLFAINNLITSNNKTIEELEKFEAFKRLDIKKDSTLYDIEPLSIFNFEKDNKGFKELLKKQETANINNNELTLFKVKTYPNDLEILKKHKKEIIDKLLSLKKFQDQSLQPKNNELKFLLEDFKTPSVDKEVDTSLPTEKTSNFFDIEDNEDEILQDISVILKHPEKTEEILKKHTLKSDKTKIKQCIESLKADLIEKAVIAKIITKKETPEVEENYLLSTETPKVEENYLLSTGTPEVEENKVLSSTGTGTPEIEENKVLSSTGTGTPRVLENDSLNKKSISESFTISKIALFSFSPLIGAVKSAYNAVDEILKSNFSKALKSVIASVLKSASTIGFYALGNNFLKGNQNNATNLAIGAGSIISLGVANYIENSQQNNKENQNFRNDELRRETENKSLSINSN